MSKINPALSELVTSDDERHSSSKFQIASHCQCLLKLPLPSTQRGKSACVGKLIFCGVELSAHCCPLSARTCPACCTISRTISTADLISFSKPTHWPLESPSTRFLQWRPSLGEFLQSAAAAYAIHRMSL